MNPQFDTRPLSCKQRQQARVKSSYSLGFPRIAAREAESYQLHAPCAVWSLSVRAGASIAHSNARQSRSGGRRRARQSIPTSSHGANVQPATLLWEFQARCPATCYARTRKPFASLEKRTGCQRCLSLKLLSPHPLKKESLKRYWESNGGRRIGDAWSILAGHFASEDITHADDIMADQRAGHA